MRPDTLIIVASAILFSLAMQVQARGWGQLSSTKVKELTSATFDKCRTCYVASSSLLEIDASQVIKELLYNNGNHPVSLHTVAELGSSAGGRLLCRLLCFMERNNFIDSGKKKRRGRGRKEKGKGTRRPSSAVIRWLKYGRHEPKTRMAGPPSEDEQEYRHFLIHHLKSHPRDFKTESERALFIKDFESKLITESKAGGGSDEQVNDTNNERSNEEEVDDSDDQEENDEEEAEDEE